MGFFNHQADKFGGELSTSTCLGAAKDGRVQRNSVILFLQKSAAAWPHVFNGRNGLVDEVELFNALIPRVVHVQFVESYLYTGSWWFLML